MWRRSRSLIVLVASLVYAEGPSLVSSVDGLLSMFWGLLGIAIVIAVMGITKTLALSIAERTS